MYEFINRSVTLHITSKNKNQIIEILQRLKLLGALTYDSDLQDILEEIKNIK